MSKSNEPVRARSIAEYVRNMPLEMSPREVVDHARAQGLDISVHYVANVRTEMRRRAGLPPRYGAIVDAPPFSPAASHARTPIPEPVEARFTPTPSSVAPVESNGGSSLQAPPLRRSSDALEAQFLEVVLRLGLDRADVLMDRVRARLRQLTVADLQ
ncbi:MAG: hypothetical protein ACHREM_25460 [Polyangiales bacterium]